MKKLPLLLLVFVILTLLAVAWRLPFGVGSSASSHAAAGHSSVARQVRTGADDATLAARDASQRVVQAIVRNAADREAAQKLGTVIEDYGSFVVIAMDEEKATAALKENPDLAAIETTVSLRGITFEPLTENSLTSPTSSGKTSLRSEAGSDYYIVQFAAPVRDEWLEEIRAAGGDVIQYVPNQAFFVFASAEAMTTIAQHPRVRWTGAFHPTYGADNLSPEMRARAALPRRSSLLTAGAEKGLFDIAIFNNKDLDAVAKSVTDFGVTVRNKIVLPNNYFNVLRVEMEPPLNLPVLQISGILSVEPYTQPMREDERAALIVAGNFASVTQLNWPGYNALSQFGVDGTGVTVSVVDDGVGIPGDGGFYMSGSNALNGPMRGATVGAQGHGHLNATIIAGDSPFSVLDPLGYNYGLGIARKAHIVNLPLLRTGYTGTEADTCNDTVTTVGPNGVKGFIANNSWGAGTNGSAYDSYAAQYDGFVRDASAAAGVDPLVIVFSAGNSGTNGLTRPKAAKNIIAVGNSENIRTELSASANNIDDLNSTSSKGPAADGRIKPDIIAPGTAITGGRSGADVLFGNIDSIHRWSSGTSHAAPQVAGAAALFTQFWKNNNAGVNPSPALVKAALINGAQEMNGAGTEASVPNGAEGWGRLNLQNVLNTGVPTKYVNETSTLSSVGDEATLTGVVANSSRPFRISLVWTDPPGTVDPALVNNLDLEVTVGGVTYKGNVFANGLSVSGGTADNRNNVENIFLPAGLSVGMPVTIRVRAVGLNGDGVLGNGDPTDQHFALVAFNYSDSGGCNYGLNPASQSYAAIGGSGAVNVNTGPGCNWVAVSNAAWLQINGATSGTGNGSVGYTVLAINGPQRTGTMTIAGQTLTIAQSGNCPNINLTPATLPDGTAGAAYNQTITAGGGNTFTVVAGALPNGVSLSLAGALAGTPTTLGAFSFTIRSTDALGCAGTQTYTLVINSPGLMFYPLPQPIRLLDTRLGQSACDTPGAPIAAGTNRTQLARLSCGGGLIPSTAKAITGNLTVLNNTAQTGYLTIYPDGQTAPLASNMIYGPNVILSNNFTVGLSTDGKFNIFGERTIDVVIDISGYYAPPGAGGLYYHPLSKPIRLLDSRPGQGNCDSVGTPIGAGASIMTLARVSCEGLTIPTAAQAIVGNATVINGSGQVGYLTIYPNGVTLPLASNLIYYPGQILSNAFTVSLNASGEFNIFGERQIDMVIDVAGYYSNEAVDANGPGLLFTPLVRPVRTLDTRLSQGNCDSVSTPITGGNSIATPGRLTCEAITIPATAQSVLGNVTIINQTGTAGFLTLYPDGVTQPVVSNMIYFPNQILSNAFVVGLNAGTGQFRIFAERTLDAVVDVSGFFAP